MAETDIRDELSDHGVTSVERVRIKGQGQEKETTILFWTFCNSSLSKDIHLGYLRVKVEGRFLLHCVASNAKSTDKQIVSCAVQTDVTWLKGDNPVRPKAPPVKGTQTEKQTVTPQQVLMKASQARPGRSSSNRSQVEIANGVAAQRKTLVPVRCASASKGGKKLPVRVPLKEPDRLKKMEQDPIKLYNRFENLLDGGSWVGRINAFNFE